MWGIKGVFSLHRNCKFPHKNGDFPFKNGDFRCFLPAISGDPSPHRTEMFSSCVARCCRGATAMAFRNAACGPVAPVARHGAVQRETVEVSNGMQINR